MTDAELTSLYKRHHGWTVARAYRQLLDFGEAEEVSHDAWVQVIKHKDDYDPGRSPFAAWVRFILDRLILYKLRRRVIGGHTLLFVPRLDNVVASSPRRTHDDLYAAINGLGEKHKAAIRTTYIEERSYDDAAAMLGIPRSTLVYRLEAAITAMRDKLQARHRRVRRRRTFSGKMVA